MKRILNIDEASELLGYKKSYLYRLTSAGTIPYSKPNGKKLYFDRDRLEEWMLSNPNVTDHDQVAETYIRKL